MSKEKITVESVTQNIMGCIVCSKGSDEIMKRATKYQIDFLKQIQEEILELKINPDESKLTENVPVYFIKSVFQKYLDEK